MLNFMKDRVKAWFVRAELSDQWLPKLRLIRHRFGTQFKKRPGSPAESVILFLYKLWCFRKIYMGITNKHKSSLGLQSNT